MKNYDFKIKNNKYTCNYTIDDKIISKCEICVNNNTWTITAWFTNNEYKNQGYGTAVLRALTNYLNNLFGKPESVEYVWNGDNEYVYDWLTNNFDPISKCPIAVQKTANDDDWDSHIYYLNTEKFLNYFCNEEIDR